MGRSFPPLGELEAKKGSASMRDKERGETKTHEQKCGFTENLSESMTLIFFQGTRLHMGKNIKRDSASHGANGRANEDAAAAGRAGGPERSVLRLREHRRRARAFGYRGRGTKPEVAKRRGVLRIKSLEFVDFSHFLGLVVICCHFSK